jgi:hypothetical protein
MLTIRKEQMAALSTYMRESYFLQTRQKLARLFPDDPRIKDRPTMRTLIEEGIRQAAAYRMVEQRAVTLFIFLLFDLGVGFEKQPSKRWMQRILLDKELDAQEKMDVIYKRLELAAAKP